MSSESKKSGARKGGGSGYLAAQFLETFGKQVTTMEAFFFDFLLCVIRGSPLKWAGVVVTPYGHFKVGFSILSS